MKQLFSILVLLLCASCKPAQTKERSAAGCDLRIISTAPALTEIVCAVGAIGTLAGRTDACDYPPELIRNTPVTGKFSYPNIEQVIALQPTHLLESFLVDPHTRSTIKNFGIKVEHIPCSRMGDIPIAIRRIGEITAHTNEAQKLARTIEDGLTRAVNDATNDTQRYRTLLLFDHTPPVTCAANTFVSELTALAGGINIAESLTKEYNSISLEWIVDQDPELIICFFKTNKAPVKLFKNRAGWQQIKAVKEGRVIAPENLDIICRPGPRVIQGVQELRKLIQGNFGP